MHLADTGIVMHPFSNHCESSRTPMRCNKHPNLIALITRQTLQFAINNLTLSNGKRVQFLVSLFTTQVQFSDGETLTDQILFCNHDYQTKQLKRRRPCIPCISNRFCCHKYQSPEGPFIEAFSECSWLYEESCCLGKSHISPPQILNTLSPPQSIEG